MLIAHLTDPHIGLDTATWPDHPGPAEMLRRAFARVRGLDPAPEVLQRYADLGLAVLGNAECGAITWQSWDSARMGCLRRDKPRYWWHQVQNFTGISQVKSGT